MDVLKDLEVIEYNPYRATPSEVEWYKKNVQNLGQVPGMVLSDGKVMTESGAICLYLAEKYNKLLPDPEEKPAYLMWLVQSVSTADPSFSHLFSQWYKKTEEERDSWLIGLHVKRTRDFLAGLERHLAGRTYICGDRFTAADVVTGYSVFSIRVLESYQPLMEGCPRVIAYLTLLAARPAFIKWLGTVESTRANWLSTTKVEILK